MAGVLLDLLERYPVIWEDEWCVARALEGCAHVVSDPEMVERLIFLLFRMRRAVRPETERVRLNAHNREQPEGRDLRSDAINEPRGIAAGAASVLAKRFFENDDALPELLFPLLRHFCRDAVASVRAAVIQYLPFFLHKSGEHGWRLMGDCYREPQGALWELAERLLYYNYHASFERVSGYLDRILLEAPNSAGGTWGRIAALASLQGHIDEGTLFQRLEQYDNDAMWQGAATVFSANLGNRVVGDASRMGLLYILRCDPLPNGTLPVIDRSLKRDKLARRLDTEVAEAYIAVIQNGTKLYELHGFIEWLSEAVAADPLGWLSVVEKFSLRLQVFEEHAGMLRGEALVKALVEILREADESDDPELSLRAITLQDRFLRLGLHGMEEMVEKASVRA